MTKHQASMLNSVSGGPGYHAARVITTTEVSALALRKSFISGAVVGALVAAFLAVAVPQAAIAQKSSIPTPESFFGYSIGADGKMLDYEQSIEYFKKLAAASNRIHLLNVGKTSFGREWTVAIITSSQNYAKLDHYRQINMRLAHPLGLTDEEAHRLAREGKVIVDISGGLHATESAGSQHTPQLAYELLSKATTDPAIKEIFDNVIFFLWPTINPDGQDIVVHNCWETMAGKPALTNEPYEKYMGHDNNRDSYMMNGIESRLRQRVWREWEPDIIYVHHQSSPFPTRIWIPPFADPVGLRAPAIPAREINTIGTFIAQELDAHGQPGATHMLATFDAYYPGYIDYMAVYQNIPSWWTETQGGGCASTRTTKEADLPRDYKDEVPTALYLSPWIEGSWSLRDAVNIMVTASMATLRYGAKFKDDVLYNRYQSGRDVIRKYATKGPFAYIVPQAQRDPVAPIELLRRFAFHGIRISRLDHDATYEGVSYPKGTWVIPMDQEFASLVQEIFEVQHYPAYAGDTPYDAAGWTLPFQMGVNVIEAAKPLSAEFKTAMKPVPPGKPVDWRTAPDEPLTTNPNVVNIVPRPGGITGTGDQVLLDPVQNNSFKLLTRALAEGGKVSVSGSGTASRYLVSGVPSAKLDAWAAELWVTGERTSGASGTAVSGTPPRIGLGNEGMAWTEWLLDTFGVKYQKVSQADLAAGNLSSKFDVLVLPGGVGGGGRGGAGGGGGRGGGRGRGAGAAGATGDDVRAVDEFVKAGGTVITWENAAASTAAALQLPLRNVTAGLARNAYFAGTSIMQVMVDTAHPVMAGMPERADVNVQTPPSFTTLDGFEGLIIARYPKEGSPLRSGFLTAGAEKYLQGNAAALDVKHGAGHVLLLAFNPIWRGQPTASFRVVLNSLFFGKEIAAQAKGTPGF